MPPCSPHEKREIPPFAPFADKWAASSGSPEVHSYSQPHVAPAGRRGMTSTMGSPSSPPCGSAIFIARKSSPARSKSFTRPLPPDFKKVVRGRRKTFAEMKSAARKTIATQDTMRIFSPLEYAPESSRAGGETATVAVSLPHWNVWGP